MLLMTTTADAKSTPHFDRIQTAILDAAAGVFSEEGVGANLAAVAAAAGVSRATLYRYFPNRDALLEALSLYALSQAGERLADAGLERASLEDAIERIARALVAVGDRYAVVASEQIKCDPAIPERLIGDPVRGVLERGIAHGEIRRDIPVEMLAALFGGTVMAAIKLTRHHQVGQEEASSAAAALFLNGARAQ
jgi:TetR/AcrR family transcriptional regulator, mexCD-oprJ operon repressor